MIKQGRGIQREMTIEREERCIFQCDEFCLACFCFCFFQIFVAQIHVMCFRFEILVRKPKKMFALDTRLGKSVDGKCVIYISYFLMMMKHTLVKFWQIDMDLFFFTYMSLCELTDSTWEGRWQLT